MLQRSTAVIVVVPPAAKLTLSGPRPRLIDTSKIRSQLKIRQARHQERLAKGKAVIDWEYAGTHVSVLLMYGCFTEEEAGKIRRQELDGAAYDSAVTRAHQKFWADVIDGKLFITR
jgi:hypothetical protein